MNQSVSRIEAATPVVSAPERTVPAVRSVTATVAATPGGEQSAAARTAEALVAKTSAAASYARVRADIAETIATMRQQQEAKASDAVGTADTALIAMMPTPVVVLPMPPTDEDMIEFVAQVAQAVMQQAVQTRASQARVPASTVDAAIA